MVALSGDRAFLTRETGPGELELVSMTPAELAVAEYDVGPVAEERERPFRERLEEAMEEGRRRAETEPPDPERREFHHGRMGDPHGPSTRTSLREWGMALREHRRHEQFRVEDWAFNLRVGFSCRCCGDEEVWEGPLHGMFGDDEDVRLFRALHLVARLEPDVERRLSIAGATVDEYEAEVARCHRAYVDRVAGPDALRERQRAHTRAEKLLRGFLTREQWREYRQKKAFHTVGQDGASYRVEVGSSRNVVKVVDGKDVMRYCVVPKGPQVPVPDLMLAVKLMLEGHIDEFMKLANKEDLTLVREERVRRTG